MFKWQKEILISYLKMHDFKNTPALPSQVDNFQNF